MISYREQLAKIGVAPTDAVSYQAFASRPNSLRQAMRSMDAPSPEQWKQVSDIYRDDFWTDEVQGVAWNGSHWIFSTNANQKKPDVEDKAIYVFEGGQSLGDGEWVTRIKYKDVPHPVEDTVESDDHWGQLTYRDGRVYAAHFWSEGPREGRASVVVFKSNGAELSFEKWIELDLPESPTDGRKEKAEFQGINPWDGMFYTCFGGGDIHEFFKHDPESGSFTGETLKFDVPATLVQGACFSPNGHLYIASNATVDEGRSQTILYYSALNGHRFGEVRVPAEEGMPDQELEGICYADLSIGDQHKAQIHAVLLENRDVSLDNIFFKSFAAEDGETV